MNVAESYLCCHPWIPSYRISFSSDLFSMHCTKQKEEIEFGMSFGSGTNDSNATELFEILSRWPRKISRLDVGRVNATREAFESYSTLQNAFAGFLSHHSDSLRWLSGTDRPAIGVIPLEMILSTCPLIVNITLVEVSNESTFCPTETFNVDSGLTTYPTFNVRNMVCIDTAVHLVFNLLHCCPHIENFVIRGWNDATDELISILEKYCRCLLTLKIESRISRESLESYSRRSGVRITYIFRLAKLK